MLFSGSFVALVTPMTQGQVDWGSLRQLCQWHLSAETSGLVILGTTGEAATLSAAEQEAVVECVCQEVAGQLPVVVGSGCFSTQRTIERTRRMAAFGVDACLVVTPYYNKPSQAGLQQHYGAVADACEVPIILYNVPSRTGVDLLPQTVIQLVQRHENIVALKDATADLARVPILRQALSDSFALLSGDDATTAAFIEAGGHGAISVTANVVPHSMAMMCQAALAGEHQRARHIDAKLAALHACLFIDSNPVPVKWLLAHMQKIQTDELRLPLVGLSEAHQQQLSQVWQQYQSQHVS